MLRQPKTQIFHTDPQLLNLAAWLLSTDHSEIKALQSTLENSWSHHGDLELKNTMPSSSVNAVAGVVNGKLTPLQPF